MNSFKESPSETTLVENSDSIKLSTRELSLLSLNEAGRVLGNSINRTYALIYAVFINSSPILLSIMTSVRNLLELASQSIFGRYSDIYGRKPFLLVGLFISAVISFFFPIITDPVIFLFAMIIYSLAFENLSDDLIWVSVGEMMLTLLNLKIIFSMEYFLNTDILNKLKVLMSHHGWGII